MEQIILRETNFNRLKELVRKNKGKEIVFTSEDDDLNRKVIEKLSVQVFLVSLDLRKDYSKQRDSGLNEIMVRILKKKGIKVGISLDELVNSKNKEGVLSRLGQNVFLCNKGRVQMKFILGKEKRSLYDLKSLGLVLGMPTWMVKGL